MVLNRIAASGSKNSSVVTVFAASNYDPHVDGVLGN